MLRRLKDLVTLPSTNFYQNDYIFTKKIYFIFLIFIILIFSFSIYKRFLIINALKSGSSFAATITNQYKNTLKDPKKQSTTFVIVDNYGIPYSFRSSGLFKNLRGKDIEIYAKSNCNILQILKRCYLYGVSFKIKNNKKLSSFLERKIYSQHNVDFDNPTEYLVNKEDATELQKYLSRDIFYDFNYAANLFSGLFLGSTLDKKLRDSISILGIAHVIAISGMHLGVISMIILICVVPIYKFFHRFFPYRNTSFDTSLVTFFILFLYLYLIDFQPSFLRAFVMSFVAILFLFFGFRVVNFVNLLACSLLIVSFNPNLFFNVGFILSVSGVFYIFLYLKHFRFKNLLQSVVLSFIIFFQMSIIVHYFFPIFSPFQLMSIPISIVFIVFFPFLIFLHLVGLGHIFDDFINIVVMNPLPYINIYSTRYLFFGYIILSIISIFSKKIYFLSIIISIIFFMTNSLIFFNLIQFSENFLLKVKG